MHRPGRFGGNSRGTGRQSPRAPGADCRAAVVAAAGGALHRGGAAEAPRCPGAVARAAGPARSWGEQIPRLAQDRPHRRPALGGAGPAPTAELRRAGVGQRGGPARVRRPGARHLPVWQPARARGRCSPPPARRRSRPRPQRSGGDSQVQRLRLGPRTHLRQEPAVCRDHLARHVPGRRPAGARRALQPSRRGCPSRGLCGALGGRPADRLPGGAR